MATVTCTVNRGNVILVFTKRFISDCNILMSLKTTAEPGCNWAHHTHLLAFCSNEQKHTLINTYIICTNPMTPVCGTTRPQEKKRIKKRRPAQQKLTSRAGFVSVTYWESEHIDQLLSCCFLPHYQTTQMTFFGQAHMMINQNCTACPAACAM